MTDTTRLQRFLERIQEDERLRGDLMGDAATAIVTWASAQVKRVASDPARPDAAVEADVKAIRMAASQAARNGDSTAEQVVAEASALLAQASPSASASTPAPTPTAPSQAMTTDHVSDAKPVSLATQPAANPDTTNLLQVRTNAPFRRVRRCQFWKKPVRKGR